MNLTQSTLQKCFTVEHKGKIYYVDYINSDDQIMFGNRDYWEVIDEEWEETEDNKLKIKLINFCIRHFDDYKPNINLY